MPVQLVIPYCADEWERQQQLQYKLIIISYFYMLSISNYIGRPVFTVIPGCIFLNVVIKVLPGSMRAEQLRVIKNIER